MFFSYLYKVNQCNLNRMCSNVFMVVLHCHRLQRVNVFLFPIPIVKDTLYLRIPTL